MAADLRSRIESGEWATGEKLDGEHGLANHYGVSRATVRTALQDLESRGLTMTRHGLGTMVMVSGSPYESDIRRLESTTDTITNRGMKASVGFRSILVRSATDREVDRLRLDRGAEVLATERSIKADGELVGFSYDVIPRSILGTSFDLSEVSGSLFAVLEGVGVRAVVAVSEVHADHGDHIGWGERPADASYLKLVQLHFDESGRPVVEATTYYLEGGFSFGLVRHR